MKSIQLLAAILMIVFSTQCFSQNKLSIEKRKSFSIGETIEVHSTILDENRVLNIYLPHGYSPDSTKNYPVIYLLDGSIDEDFIHISGLVQFGSFSWINMIPETIVVGIANVDRKRDFTYPTDIKELTKAFPTTGGSEDFINFIESELQPFIDAEYHTDTIKTIIGQSLGGLLATEILFKKPDLFDNYIIISPSLWWDEESLKDTDPKDYSSKKSIYIGVGAEGEIMERVADELYVLLMHREKKGTQLDFGFFEKRNHGDVLHEAAYAAFEKIFGK